MNNCSEIFILFVLQQTLISMPNCNHIVVYIKRFNSVWYTVNGTAVFVFFRLWADNLHSLLRLNT